MAKGYNCPNCGAPIGYSEVCQYCGTRLRWIPVQEYKIVTVPAKIEVLRSVVQVPVELLHDHADLAHLMVMDNLKREFANELPKLWTLTEEDDLPRHLKTVRATLMVAH